MATLAEMLRQGADRLVNLPSEAQRFITNPQAFTQALTGRNFLPRETGFAAGAMGLPPTEMSVLDPNQAPYMQGYSQGEPIGYAGMAAPFAAPATVATAKALAPKLGQVTENYMVKQGMIQPLTAYHGTPHTIQGQFDINKVGTGEGAQAYGHGMYFAESPDVATQYKSSTIPENALTDPQKNVVEWAKYEAGDEGPLAHLLDMQQLYTKKYGKENVDKAVEFFKGGNLYKVDIPDADILNMLDWDKSLTKQTPEVQAILKDRFPSAFDDPRQATGQALYKEQVKKMGMSGQQNPEQFMSDYLNEFGIKGIRYLDEGSRKTGGTSNFVVFEPSTVKILEQNNKPVTRKELIQEQIDKIE